MTTTLPLTRSEWEKSLSSGIELMRYTYESPGKHLAFSVAAAACRYPIKVFDICNNLKTRREHLSISAWLIVSLDSHCHGVLICNSMILDPNCFRFRLPFSEEKFLDVARPFTSSKKLLIGPTLDNQFVRWGEYFELLESEAIRRRGWSKRRVAT